MKLFSVSRTRQIDAETLTVSESTFKNKGNITLNTFRNVAYVSSYLRTKIFARKRDCNIFKTANTKTLIKAILESPYKPLNKP